MEKLLIVLVLMVGVIAIAQMMRVYEISSKLRGKKEEEISHSDNVFNANMMLVFMLAFYAFFFWLLARHGNGGIGPSASVHGDTLDWLLNFNFYIIIAVFFVTNTLLFVFAFKYYHRPGTKAYWFPHNNKLELLWTSVPAVVLATIIILGLRAWNDITSHPTLKTTKVIEVYSKQFDWTARYAGEDNQLGRADFRMNSSENPLGVLTYEAVGRRKDEIRTEIVDLCVKYYKHTYDKKFLKNVDNNLLKTTSKGKQADMFVKMLTDGLKMVDENSTTNTLAAFDVMSSKKAGETFDKIERLQRHLIKLSAVAKTITDKDNAKAMDDIVTKELVLVKGQEYEFKFRSMDVIHSAYFPHFRAQMNTVPGMVTRFKFIPKYTTTEMRKLMSNDKFEYILLCNKICGSAHSNMQMKITVVEDEKALKDWLATGKTIKSILFPEVAKAAEENTSVHSTKATDSTKITVLNPVK